MVGFAGKVWQTFRVGGFQLVRAETCDSNMSDKPFFDRVRTAIGDVVSDFSQYPADYLFESDLQCALFGSLRDTFKDVAFVSQSKDLLKFFGDKLIIHPVKSEYPYNIEGHTRDRFDLVLLDTTQDPLHRIYHQHCRLGIEIKLWNPDGTGGSVWPDVANLKDYLDAARQREMEFSGLAILFVLPGAEGRLHTELKCVPSVPTITPNEVSLHVVTTAEWQGMMPIQNEQLKVFGKVASKE